MGGEAAAVRYISQERVEESSTYSSAATVDLRSKEEKQMRIDKAGDIIKSRYSYIQPPSHTLQTGVSQSISARVHLFVIILTFYLPDKYFKMSPNRWTC